MENKEKDTAGKKNLKRYKYKNRGKSSNPKNRESGITVASKNTCDYESMFIHPSVVSGRQEKTTYLREEFYNRIMKIILPYGNPRLSVFAYVDAVLEHHFEVYKQDIMEIYNKMNSAPY